jgi:hypothetical protein
MKKDTAAFSMTETPAKKTPGPLEAKAPAVPHKKKANFPVEILAALVKKYLPLILENIEVDLHMKPALHFAETTTALRSQGLVDPHDNNRVRNQLMHALLNPKHLPFVRVVASTGRNLIMDFLKCFADSVEHANKLVALNGWDKYMDTKAPLVDFWFFRSSEERIKMLKQEHLALYNQSVMHQQELNAVEILSSDEEDLSARPLDPLDSFSIMTQSQPGDPKVGDDIDDSFLDAPFSCFHPTPVKSEPQVKTEPSLSPNTHGTGAGPTVVHGSCGEDKDLDTALAASLQMMETQTERKALVDDQDKAYRESLHADAAKAGEKSAELLELGITKEQIAEDSHAQARIDEQARQMAMDFIPPLTTATIKLIARGLVPKIPITLQVLRHGPLVTASGVRMLEVSDGTHSTYAKIVSGHLPAVGSIVTFEESSGLTNPGHFERLVTFAASGVTVHGARPTIGTPQYVQATVRPPSRLTAALSSASYQKALQDAATEQGKGLPTGKANALLRNTISTALASQVASSCPFQMQQLEALAAASGSGSGSGAGADTGAGAFMMSAEEEAREKLRIEQAAASKAVNEKAAAMNAKPKKKKKEKALVSKRKSSPEKEATASSGRAAKAAAVAALARKAKLTGGPFREYLCMTGEGGKGRAFTVPDDDDQAEAEFADATAGDYRVLSVDYSRNHSRWIVQAALLDDEGAALVDENDIIEFDLRSVLEWMGHDLSAYVSSESDDSGSGSDIDLC